jgi:DNA-3-methyladenine glycosylase I
MLEYHDHEWGNAVRDEHGLFERISLEGAQAGLSWALILKRRDGYRRAFAGFDPVPVSKFTAADVERLMEDPGIIRNRAKIASVISNARMLVAMHDRGETLGEVVWSFVDDATVHNAWRRIEEVPATTAASKAMSVRLRKMGFGFVGPTTCYATMQAAGLVNDHVVGCPRWSALGGVMSGRRRRPGASAGRPH